jgi:hypothetical protein
MVIIGAVEVRNVGGEAMNEYVVGGLDMEGLLDFGVWRNVEMEEDQRREKNGEKVEYIHCRN